jgi:hypothetical protein
MPIHGRASLAQGNFLLEAGESDAPRRVSPAAILRFRFHHTVILGRACNIIVLHYV